MRTLSKEFSDYLNAAIGIKTELWNKIVEILVNNGWKVTYKYDNFDAGIDFDMLFLEKSGEEIIFGWDNWLEGEILCSDDRLKNIETLLGESLKIGKPTNVKPEVISINRKWTNDFTMNRIRKIKSA